MERALSPPPSLPESKSQSNDERNSMLHEFVMLDAQMLYGRVLQDAALIELEEAELGIAFPGSYKRLVREHDGAVHEPAGVRFVNPQTGEEEMVSCNKLIPFQASESGGSMTMAEANRELIPFLPLGVVVFGIEAGGYLFGFDYRGQIRGEVDVPVVLLHDDNEPEHRIIRVADSFDDLLARLENPFAVEPDTRIA